MKIRQSLSRFMHIMSKIVTIIFGVTLLGLLFAYVAGLLPPRSQWTREQTDLFGITLFTIFLLMQVFVVIPTLIPVLFQKKQQNAASPSARPAAKPADPYHLFCPQPIHREDDRLVLMAGEFLPYGREIHLIGGNDIPASSWYSLVLDHLGRPCVRHHQLGDHPGFLTQLPDAFLEQGCTVQDVLALCDVHNQYGWCYAPDTLISFESPQQSS